MESQIINNCEKCEYKTVTSSNISKKESTHSPDGNSYDWSRLCPMGQLLEPKLYPVNSKIPPPATNHRENQPYQEANIFLRNLREKYFDRTNKLPPYDFLRRVNEDRLRSTYQIAYGHNVEYNCLDYEDFDYPISKLPETEEEFVPCKKPLRPPYIGGHDVPGIRYDRTSFGDDFSDMRLDEDREGLFTGSSAKVTGGSTGKSTGKSSGGGGGAKSAGAGAKSTGRGKNTSGPGGKYSSGKNNKMTGQKNRGAPTASRVPTKNQNSMRADGQQAGMDIQTMQIIDDEPWISEYQDVIDRTGEEIILNQLHHPKPKKKTKKH